MLPVPLKPWLFTSLETTLHVVRADNSLNCLAVQSVESVSHRGFRAQRFYLNLLPVWGFLHHSTDLDEPDKPVTSVFSERELTFTFAIRYRPSVCRLSVVCLSVTFVRPTQAVQIFGNISTALGTLAILGHPLKILRRSSQENPSAGGVKDKRGSKI